MAIVLNGTTGITAPDIDVTAQSTDIVTTGDVSAVDGTFSGGVYLGGTGSANYLDDYEEGTFTPTVSQGTVSAGNARYIKVGKLVTLWFSMNQFSNRSSTEQITISGLPFTGAGGVAHGGVFGQYCDNDAQSIYMIGSGVSLRIVRNDSGAFHYVQYNDLNSTASSFYIGMTYDTP